MLQYRNALLGSSLGSGRARLSLYPVAKNLRFLATSVARNSQLGRGTKLSERPRTGESVFCKKHLGWDKWKPWIWMPNSESNRQAVETLLGASKWNSAPSVGKVGRLDPDTRSRLVPFVNHLAALDVVFNLSASMSEKIQSVSTSEVRLAEAIGVHVRRGDTQSRGAVWNLPGRNDQFSIDRYANACRKAADVTGLSTLFVISDSDDAAEELGRALPDLKIFTNSFDRSQFFRQLPGQSLNIEEHVKKKPELADFYVTSTLADLVAISQCAAFVGPIATSEMSRTAYYLSLAKSRLFKPYFAVGDDLSIHAKGFALLD